MTTLNIQQRISDLLAEKRHCELTFHAIIKSMRSEAWHKKYKGKVFKGFESAIVYHGETLILLYPEKPVMTLRDSPVMVWFKQDQMALAALFKLQYHGIDPLTLEQ